MAGGKYNIGNETIVDIGIPAKLKIESELSGQGNLKIHVQPEQEAKLNLHIRVPSWNGSRLLGDQAPASGYDSRQAGCESFRRVWIFSQHSLIPPHSYEEFAQDLLGGCVVINGKTLKFIPYFLWGNRGESQMTV